MQQPIALDATTINLCLSLFPWAIFRKAKGAIKLHTMIEIHSSIPVFIDITHGKVHEVNVLDTLAPEPGSFLVMDRGYLDFARLYALHQALAFFVIRAKSNLQFRRQYSHSVDRSSGVRSDQTGILTGPLTSTLYPVPLRRRDLLLGGNGQALRLSDQQFFSSSTHRRQSLPLSLANRTLFQMDQTASTNQAFLWHFSKQREDSNLDWSLGLCADSDHQKAAWPEAQPLHNSTNSQSLTIREKAHSKPI